MLREEDKRLIDEFFTTISYEELKGKLEEVGIFTETEFTMNVLYSMDNVEFQAVVEEQNVFYCQSGVAA